MPREHDASDDGQVSEVTSLDPGSADTPISDDQAVAGNPSDESGHADEGPAGPNANPNRGAADPWWKTLFKRKPRRGLSG
ncbi:hypothetical protein [Nocardioides sp. SYSU D00038]|uniref:hypothetical protein n=1 Tax=Nocardioides sp. SYSU D00038 TaxID=2812554 RepID=UPI001968890F|nr:hypothetical protein [Nocardioides sp. SYSU D00038]